MFLSRYLDSLSVRSLDNVDALAERLAWSSVNRVYVAALNAVNGYTLYAGLITANDILEFTPWVCQLESI